MHAALRLLVIACLVWCALGFDDPAFANPLDRHTTVATGHTNDVPTDGDQPPLAADHHHCPIAPDLRLPTAAEPVAIGMVRPIAAYFAALSSLTRAPPLHPPAA